MKIKEMLVWDLVEIKRRFKENYGGSYNNYAVGMWLY